MIPATWFQSLNAGFIVLFAVAVGKFLGMVKSLGRESALLFQMAVGVIIMALGFAVMSEAALEFERKWIKRNVLLSTCIFTSYS